MSLLDRWVVRRALTPVAPAPPSHLVGYHPVRSLPLPPHSLAYDYLFGSDGVFIAARSSTLDVRIPLAHCAIRGLQPVGSYVGLTHGKIPGDLWDEIIGRFDDARAYGHEHMLGIAYSQDRRGRGGSYYLVEPAQTATATSVHYTPQEGWLLEVHSHHDMSAYFSYTDTRDEQGLRIYAVVGRMNEPKPQVSLRVGCYGHFTPIAWPDVFDGQTDAIRDTIEASEMDEITFKSMLIDSTLPSDFPAFPGFPESPMA